MKIENLKLKIIRNDEKNFNTTIVTQNLMHEIRKVLDNYSIIMVKLNDGAVNFPEEMLNNIIDNVLDRPLEIIKDELHPNKGDSVTWSLLSNQENKWIKLIGKTSQVKSCIRILHSFNKQIISISYDGVLPDKFTLSEENEESQIFENDLYICVNSDQQKNKVYLNYIKGKVTNEEFKAAADKITSWIINIPPPDIPESKINKEIKDPVKVNVKILALY